MLFVVNYNIQHQKNTQILITFFILLYTTRFTMYFMAITFKATFLILIKTIQLPL